MNRSTAEAEIRLPAPRSGMAWRAVIDAHDADAPERRIGARRPGQASRPLLAHSGGDAAAQRRASPGRLAPRRSTRSPARRGSPANGGTSRGKRTVVAPETKIALLSALGLEAGSEAEARESLTRLVDETHRRRLPFSLLLRSNDPQVAPLRDLPGGADARIVREDGTIAEWRVDEGGGVRRDLPDGRSVAERTIALPALSVGRYRLIVDGVECALTVAPPAAFCPKAASRKRFGVAAQLYALRRADENGRDQGIGDFSTLALAGEKAGGAGAAYLGVSPLHMLFPRDRERASPYSPLRPALPRSDSHRRARRRGPAARRNGRRRTLDARAGVREPRR